jgi:hypothetical protein
MITKSIEKQTAGEVLRGDFLNQGLYIIQSLDSAVHDIW